MRKFVQYVDYTTRIEFVNQVHEYLCMFSLFMPISVGRRYRVQLQQYELNLLHGENPSESGGLGEYF